MDTIVDIEWSEVRVGDRIRWITPAFVRRGVVLVKRGNSIKAKFDGMPSEVAIPNARWYFDLIRKDNGLVVIRDSKEVSSSNWSNNEATELTDAARILRTDERSLRRKLRSGVIPGMKQNGRWYVSTSWLSQGDDE